MVKHTLFAGAKTVQWGIFDGSIPPVLTICSGDSVTLTTVSGAPEVIPSPDSGLTVLPEHLEVTKEVERHAGHMMTGPIAIEGAEPGDAIEVRIIDVRLRQNWGYNAFRPGGGTIPDDFGQTSCVWTIPIDVERKIAHLPWGGEIKLTPFFGNIGVAPPAAMGPVTTIIPREFGGNLDNKELGPGSSLFLPVFNSGGLLYVGDGHAVQGDGEICGSAIETALEGEFIIILHKGMNLTSPRAETPQDYMTMAFNADLDEAVRQAVRDMVDLVSTKASISREAAYSFMSLACDVRIAQLVNRNKGAYAVFPKSLLDQYN